MMRLQTRVARQNSDRTKLRVEELESRTLLSATNPVHLLSNAADSDAGVLPDANVIVRQRYDHVSNGSVAQNFTDIPDFSAYEFDDFSTTGANTVSFLLAPGQELGTKSANTGVVGQIWSGLPDQGGSIVMSGGGIETNRGALLINFHNQVLPAGSYYITAYVNRSFADGGQWFWDQTQPVNGTEEFFYNPGGGFGFGTASIPGSVVFGVAADQAFTLYGAPAAGGNVAHNPSILGSSNGAVSNQVLQQNGSKLADNALDHRVVDAALALPTKGNQGASQDSHTVLHKGGDTGADAGLGVTLPPVLLRGE